MKKIITFLFIGLLAFTTKAQVIFEEEFEIGIPTSFTLIDGDGNIPTLGIFADDPWIGGYIFTGENDIVWAGSTSSYNPAGTSDDWMITPAIDITAENYLFWSARSPDANKRDGYEIRISTTGTNVADFDSILYSNSAENTTWTDRYLDLSGFSGETVYLAVRNNSTDKYILAIDYLLVKVAKDNDVAVTEITTNELHSNGSSVEVSGTVKNEGLNTITSVDINWSIDGGTTVNTETFTVNLDPLEEYDFTHSTKFTALNPGSFTTLDVWVSNPNGTTDPVASNDELSKGIFVNSGITTAKRPLLEEFTTAVCGWCPDGTYNVELAKSQNPDIIAVGVHAGFYRDGMTIPEHTTIAAAFTNSAPAAVIDRVSFDPGENVATADRALWLSRSNSQEAKGAPASVEITGNYNSATRQTDVTVSTEFVDYVMPGDLRLTLYVIEDSVTGTGYGLYGYDQLNYLYQRQGYEHTPYYNQGTYSSTAGGYIIKGFEHRHVLRDVYPSTDAWGDSTVFPTNINPSDAFSKTFSFQLDPTWDENQVSIVAFISYYDSDVTKRNVLNAQQVKLTEIFGVGIDESNQTQMELNIYPNPFNSQTKVEFTLKSAENVQMELFDMTGKLLMSKDMGRLNAGSHSDIIKAEDLESGFYMLKITAGENSSLQKISLMK